VRRPALRCLAALAGLFAWLGPAARAQVRTAGPTVRALAALPPGEAARLGADTSAARVVAVTRDADGVPVVHLLVRLRGLDLTPLLRAGARPGTRVGGLVSARVPLASLAGLLADSAVAEVYAAHRWSPLNDLGVQRIGVAGLRRLVAPDDFAGPVGRGVIVGFVDTGLDFTHGDFLVDSLGRSRVLYLWDQTLPGAGPGTIGSTTFSYGVECRQEDLTTAACASRDADGHGTHVAGTAAGDGSGGQADAQFAGVAPGADLIVVKTTFLSDAVVDGVNYIFARAEQLGRPAVVNLSLGSQWGPHDGTLPEEEALDSLVGPGRVVVAAAGNDGDNLNTTPTSGAILVHGAATLTAPGQQASFAVSVPGYVPAAGPNNDFVVLQLWYAAADSITVTVFRPDGSAVTSTPTSSPAGTVTEDGADGQIHIENGPGTSVALSSDHLALIVLGDLGGGTAPHAGRWTVAVTSAAAHSARPIHLWIGDGSLGEQAAFAGVTLVAGSSNGYVVAAPATASRVLAVGAYVTRLQWQDVNGHSQAYTYQERLGDLAAFSSPGPRRDGVLKPDLTAPGKGIVSARSRFAPPVGGRTMPDGAHWIMEGTSMAAPFVTGSVALLLARSPNLTPEAVRTLLVGAAQVDSFALHPFDGNPTSTPNASWGYGKLYVPPALDALAQLAALRPGTASDAIAGRTVPVGEFRVLHLLVIGDPDSSTILDSVAVTAAGGINEGQTLAWLQVYQDPARTGAVPAGPPLATATLAGDNPRVVMPLGGQKLEPGDTVSLVFTTRLDSGLATPNGATVRFDVAAPTDLYLRTASGRPVPAEGIPFRGPIVTLQSPGWLAIRALPVGSGGTVSSAPGSRFPVLRFALDASGEEPFAVRQIGIKVAGNDPDATLRVILDVNHNGVVDDGEPVLADTTAALGGDSLLLAFTPTDLLVPAGGTVQFVMDLHTSGAVPNGALFGASVAPAWVHSQALYSGRFDRQWVSGALSSGTVTTSLLSQSEALNVSENPVRGSSVIINYALSARRVSIYTFTGVRVRTFRTPPSGSLTWDLTGDDGRPVVNGVYILVVETGSGVVRHRLYVARRAGP
jgi:subtilisin family serine protease